MRAAKRSTALILGLGVLFGLARAQQPPPALPPAAESDVDFERDIGPLLEQKCATCPQIITVDTDNLAVTGKSPGRAEIRLTLGDLHDSVEVAVGEGQSEMAVNFSPDVVSILTTKGCNGSGCHGSPAGQNGFKLSLFGYDIGADHQMIIHGHDGRRVDLEDPEQSLLLRKPTFQVAHGGGRLFDVDSEEYETITSWLQSGAPLDGSGVRLEKLTLYPPERILAGVGAGQRLVADGAPFRRNDPRHDAGSSLSVSGSSGGDSLSRRDDSVDRAGVDDNHRAGHGEGGDFSDRGDRRVGRRQLSFL